MTLETLIEDARWQDLDLEALAQAACNAVFGRMTLPAEFFEVSLMGCDDGRITVLNADFRDKPTPTNVLSWPSEDRSAARAGLHPDRPDWDPKGMPVELGDIAISYDTCMREAAAQNKQMHAHVTHLLVHGLLHLLGYDHINDADAGLMEGLEVEILVKMGFSDPYRDIDG